MGMTPEEVEALLAQQGIKPGQKFSWNVGGGAVSTGTQAANSPGLGATFGAGQGGLNLGTAGSFGGVGGAGKGVLGSSGGAGTSSSNLIGGNNIWGAGGSPPSVYNFDSKLPPKPPPVPSSGDGGGGAGASTGTQESEKSIYDDMMKTLQGVRAANNRSAFAAGGRLGATGGALGGLLRQADLQTNQWANANINDKKFAEYMQQQGYNQEKELQQQRLEAEAARQPGPAQTGFDYLKAAGASQVETAAHRLAVQAGLPDTSNTADLAKAWIAKGNTYDALYSAVLAAKKKYQALPPDARNGLTEQQWVARELQNLLK